MKNKLKLKPGEGKIRPGSLRNDIIAAKAMIEHYIKWRNYSQLLTWGNYLERLVKRIPVPDAPK